MRDVCDDHGAIKCSLCIEVNVLNKELDKYKSLLVQALPWVQSYQKSRERTDWRNGKNTERVEWLEKAREVLE